MHHSRLVRLLKAITAEEFRQLLQFAKSPLFNDGERPNKVQALLELLCPYHPPFEGVGLLKAEVSGVLFPGSAFQEGKLDKLSTETVTLVRRFIALHLSGAQTEPQYWLRQAKFFRLRGLDADFRHAVGQLEKLQREAMFRGEDFFFHQFNIETEKLYALVRQNDKKSDLNLTHAIQHLDIYYIITKLEYCSYLLIQGHFSRIVSDKSFVLLEQVLDFAKDNYLGIPIVSAYCHAYKLLLGKDVDEQDYIAFKKVLEEHKQHIEADKMRTFHSCLRNYISVRYNEGHTQYLPELFSLYKDHIAQGSIYQEEGYIPASIVQNAVTVALKLGAHDWATGFLEQHRHKVAGTDEPEAIYQFNLANCLFHAGQYDRAEDMLANYQFKEMQYKLAAKRLEIKIYYETDSPLLDARLDAFKVLLHGMKSSYPAEMTAPNNYFVDILRQLLSTMVSGNPQKLAKLNHKLESLKGVAEREWLFAKVLGGTPGGWR